jgi:Ca2+-transporting ATPase
MVTDIFPALALGLGKGDTTLMNRPPRDPKLLIVTNRNWFTISLYAAAMTSAVLVAVFYCRQNYTDHPAITNNVAFLTLAFAQLFHVFNMSSAGSGMLVNDITRNKFVWIALLICALLLGFVYMIPSLRLVLGLQLLSIEMWLLSVAAGFIPLVIFQTYKIIRGKRDDK